MAGARRTYVGAWLLAQACACQGLDLNPGRWLKMRKITAAMLGNNVPPGAHVLELATTSDPVRLAFYPAPKSVALAARALGNQAVLQATAEREAIPRLLCVPWPAHSPLTIARSALAAASGGPVPLPDVVAAFDCMEGMGEDEAGALISDVRDLLPPGGRLLWIERDPRNLVGPRVEAAWAALDGLRPAAGSRGECFMDREEGYSLGVAVKPGAPRASKRTRRKAQGRQGGGGAASPAPASGDDAGRSTRAGVPGPGSKKRGAAKKGFG